MVPIMERSGYPNLGDPAGLSSSEFDVNDTDTDTDKNACAECLYCEKLFSDKVGKHRLFSLKT
jgi:hypothetical protein